MRIHADSNISLLPEPVPSPTPTPTSTAKVNKPCTSDKTGSLRRVLSLPIVLTAWSFRLLILMLMLLVGLIQDQQHPLICASASWESQSEFYDAPEYIASSAESSVGRIKHFGSIATVVIWPWIFGDLYRDLMRRLKKRRRRIQVTYLIQRLQLWPLVSPSRLSSAFSLQWLSLPLTQPLGFPFQFWVLRLSHSNGSYLLPIAAPALNLKSTQ